MNDSWFLIRGIGLYRPASPDLLEYVLDIARRMEREWEMARAPLRSLVSERELLESQLAGMQELLDSFTSEVASLRRRSGADSYAQTQLDALEDVRQDCEERRSNLQARISRIHREQEALTAQIDALHRQLERTVVRALMLACGDDRTACLHRLAAIREEVAQERKRELSAGARKGIRASAKAAFQAFTSAILEKQSQQQLDDLWGAEDAKPRAGGWDCA